MYFFRMSIQTTLKSSTLCTINGWAVWCQGTKDLEISNVKLRLPFSLHFGSVERFLYFFCLVCFPPVSSGFTLSMKVHAVYFLFQISAVKVCPDGVYTTLGVQNWLIENCVFQPWDDRVSTLTQTDMWNISCCCSLFPVTMTNLMSADPHWPHPNRMMQKYGDSVKSQVLLVPVKP